MMADDEGLEYQAPASSSSSSVSQAPTSEFACLVDYYCSNHLYRHLQNICQDRMGRGKDDDEATFWHAVGLTEEGAATEAIRELDPLQNNSELALAVNAALINAHRTAKAKDKESLDKLKDKLKKLSKDADDSALIFAGRYFLHTDKAKQSRQCLEKIYTKNPNQIQTLVMLGWLNLNSGQSRQARQALNYFEAALKLTKDKQDIGALLGRSKYYERSAKGSTIGNGADGGINRKKWERVLDDLNTVIVLYPSFTPAVIEKSRVLMIMNQWEESLQTAQRVLKKDPKDIGALRLVVLYFLTRESRGPNIQNRLNELIEALDQNEPRNPPLFYEISQLVSRLANRKKPILQQTLVLIERACKMEPSNSAYLTEQGYQLMLLEDYSQSSLCFQEASKLDEGNISALSGLIKCKILQGNYKEAQQELEFLAEISASIGSNADLTFLHALLAWLKDSNENKCMEYLNLAMMEHSKTLEEIPLGFSYFITYNPDFVLEVIQMYMQHIGTEPMREGDPPNPVLNSCIRLLLELTEIVPGMLGAQLMLSKTNFIAGNFEESERALNLALRLDPQCAPAHIIQAQICLHRENFPACSSSLEQARSLDFEIRNTPIYHLMKTKLLEAAGQVTDALAVLQAAMELPGVKKSSAASKTAPVAGPAGFASAISGAKGVVPLQDRISIFLELAAVHVKLNNIPEATKVMNDAKNEFKNTSEVTRILIADAELACKRRDFDQALNMLKSIPADNLYSTRAKIKMAEIYLVNKKNKKLYAACYQDLAQQGQTVHGFILLGEAYMKIQEPEKAIKAYEGALKLNPGDAQLSSKIGRALITTHDYKRAVQYYETAAAGGAGGSGEGEEPAAISPVTRLALLHDLAELYLSLKNFPEAIRVLESAMALTQEGRSGSGASEEDNLFSSQGDVKSFSIMADVGQASQDYKMIVESLTQAWQLQVDILSRLRAESMNPDQKRAEKETCAQLCFRLAEYYNTMNQLDKAQQFYNEALKYNEGHEKSRLALAKLHLLNNDLDACQAQCVTLMRLDQNNKDASLMLADLMFRKNEHEAATYHFQQLLEKNPTRYDALNKLIQLLRRAGKLSEAPRFLKLAEKFNAKATFAAGLHYCKGLYAWYTNDPKTALTEFNQSRKDGEWGKLALVNMIEIYLNPDNQELFQETTDAKGDNSEQVNSAERLLKDLQNLSSSANDSAFQLKVQVLESYVQMASKNKSKTDLALNNLMALCSSDATRDYVPGLLAMANAFTLRGEAAKARNQLKRIQKMKYDPDYSQDFERSWLMLADTYIAVGKYEFAQDLCKKCLAINKSSAKSWEMLGQIMEKEQSYKDAAEHYEHAWNYMNETSPTVGYKLAFNYLKAKRFVEAIDVCHKVLTAFPEYPKIRKDILAKAREALRP